MTGKHVVLIDNYDSFTWNIYEYLCQEGAQVTVIRNDAVTIAEMEKMNFDILLISPGPGHPRTDAGISMDAISSFKGKKPIFGVCMGQQCMFEVFGGEVEYAGEIVHGKTSPITHDGKGMFANVPQGVAVTRYHSLAGSASSLPECLEVTATTDNGIIMGVRHKVYAIEGVQFHPESILTEEGHMMIRNILNANSAFRDDSKPVPVKGPTGNILQTIFQKRMQDYETIMKTPGSTFEDLEVYHKLGLAPEVKDFYKHLKSYKGISVLSEIKRASPSKGDIDIGANAAVQASRYADAEVQAISVLTEPNWFKGSIKDLEIVRKAIDNSANRPCVLRKEFIFNKYQILEARLAGADTVLLIVKMLSEDVLDELIKYSRSLDMEPLVEVNTVEELQVAIKYGSKVIGVNNRNLVDFQVDLETTTDLLSQMTLSEREEIVLLGLSGISTKEDVHVYATQGVSGVLVGEALMRAGSRVVQFISELRS